MLQNTYIQYDLYDEDDCITDSNVKSQSLKWLLTLQNHDKLDLFNELDLEWHIVTVANIEKFSENDNEKQLETIHMSLTYDGWSEDRNEAITISPELSIPRKIQKINSMTPYHAYLDDDALPPCKWESDCKVVICDKCGKKCCSKCSIAEDSDTCIDCFHTQDYDVLLTAVSSSLSDQYPIDMYIVQMIAIFSMGVVVQCSNAIRKCANEIYFKSAYRLELNLQHRCNLNVKCYQYTPAYGREGTHSLCGQQRRIFCEDCTKYELESCHHCSSAREARAICHNDSMDIDSSDAVICHNHRYVACTLCDKAYSEVSRDIAECKYCHKEHCRFCAEAYILCPEQLQLEKDMEMERIRSAVSDVVIADHGFEYFDFSHANIVRLIAQYSVGIAVACSNANIDCQHEIVFGSEYEWYINVVKCANNGKNVKIYQYSPFYSTPSTRSIDGQLWRVFCEHCTENELVDCKSCHHHREAKPIDYDSSACVTSAKSVHCHNHNYVECTLCNKQYDLTVEISSCQYCEKMHCSSCKMDLRTAEVPKCIEYAKDQEIGQIFYALSAVLCFQYDFSENDEQIITLLAEYSSGAVVTCSNATRQCQNEINFDYRGQVIQNLRSSINNPSGVAVYQYCPKHITDGTSKVYGTNRRIFCEYCTSNELVDCSCCKLGKEPKAINYDPNAPVHSTKASKCNNHQFFQCSICNLEYKEDDDIKIESCERCKLMHCTKCQQSNKCTS